MSMKYLPNTADQMSVKPTGQRDPHPSIGQISGADKDPTQDTIAGKDYPSGAGKPGGVGTAGTY